VQNASSRFAADLKPYVTYEQIQACGVASVSGQPLRELFSECLFDTGWIGATKTTHAQVQANCLPGAW
jgi:hypothetical protein